MNQKLEKSPNSPGSSRMEYLSYSRMSRYLTCPEQYRLHYVERLRPKVSNASLVFGQVLHQALASLFRRQADPLEFFNSSWREVREVELKYSQKDSWDKLEAIGLKILQKFRQEELSKFGNVQAIEKSFQLSISTLALPFTGVIDLIAELQQKITIVDFKTAGSAYEDHEVALSDQLTAYQLAEPQARQIALCVLMKTKEPRIDWFFSSRNPDQLYEFLNKADYVASQIGSACFYRRPGKWCSWCDYLPVCLGNKKQAEEALVTVPL